MTTVGTSSLDAEGLDLDNHLSKHLTADTWEALLTSPSQFQTEEQM